MGAKILVAGIGNIFFSDDGFGPEVVRQVLLDDRDLPASTKVVDYGIRGMHLAYDLLDGYDALVIVDTMPRGAAAGDISILEVGPDDVGHGDFDAHGMNPVAVLGSLESLGGSLPSTYIVGCRPANMNEGIGLSPAVAAAIAAGVDVLFTLIDETVIPRITAGAHGAIASAGQR